LLQGQPVRVGIDLTNAASKSSDEVGRIMLFPTSSAVLLFSMPVASARSP
jgi:hypothetical protein